MDRLVENPTQDGYRYRIDYGMVRRFLWLPVSGKADLSQSVSSDLATDGFPNSRMIPTPEFSVASPAVGGIELGD